MATRTTSSPRNSSTTTTFYCPTSPAAISRRNQNIDEQIDPALRSYPSQSRGLPTHVPSLVPAFFPDDDPHVQDDFEVEAPYPRPRRDYYSRPREDLDFSPVDEHSASESRSRTPSGSDSPPPEYNGNGNVRFNRDLYPGYDSLGNRRGLDHLYTSPAPHIGGGGHYRPRTHYYEPPSPAPRGYAPPPSGLPGVHHTSPSTSQRKSAPPIPPELVQMYYPGIPIPPKTIEELIGIEPGAPISLNSLKDPEPGQKPDYTYATLVKLAIWSSPKKCLTLQEIYDALEKRFPFFASNSSTGTTAWKVRDQFWSLFAQTFTRITSDVHPSLSFVGSGVSKTTQTRDGSRQRPLLVS